MSPPPPPRGVVDRLAASARPGVPGQPTAAGLAIIRAAGPLLRLAFRPRLEGWGRVPADRPALLVANHSGGGAVDVACVAWLWLQAGARPPLTALAHPVAFHVPLVAELLRAWGVVPSTHDAGERALRAGVSALVFPGGDHEAFRPVWQARRVDLAGRTGFLRLARRAGVPIVPVGIRGTSLATPVLWRSRLLPWLLVLPRLLGLKRLPVTVPGLLGAAALGAALGPADPLALGLALWLWAWNPLALQLPCVPATVTVTAGAPLEPADLFPGGPDAEGDLGPAYARVEAALQALVSGGA